MGCGCHNQITSWYDLQNAEPKNPFDFLALAMMSGQLGTLTYSTAYINDGGTWAASPITPATNSSIVAWNTVQDSGSAAQWGFQHLMTNADSDLATPLKGLVFIRGGVRWRNAIRLTFASPCNYLEVSFLDNAGTKGDDEGAVPVIRFGSPLAATTHTLFLTTKMTGDVMLGLRTEVTATGDDSMFEMRCIAT